MPLSVGDNLPEATLFEDQEGNIRELNPQTLAAGRRIVIFGVPGPFTPTCSERHLPGFVEHGEAIRAEGVDEIYCIAVNDPFVMEAWAEAQQVGGEVVMLSDGNGEFTEAIDLQRDMRKAGMGIRCKRFAMVVENGMVEWLKVDESGLQESSAENLLDYLKRR